MNHPAKSFARLDATAAPLRHGWTYGLRRGEAQRSVRPMAVVVIHEDAKDTREMFGAEDQSRVLIDAKVRECIWNASVRRQERFSSSNHRQFVGKIRFSSSTQ